MPTLLVQDGFRFFFYSNEGSPLEPSHVHVEHGEGVAKYWLAPVQLAESVGMKAGDLRRARAIIEANVQNFQERWDGHFHA